MPTDLAIRPLRQTDWESWSQLWTAYLAFYKTTLPAEVYETAFARMLSGETGEFQGLICEIDHVPVGLAHFVFHRNLWAIEDTCYLMDLYTAPDARGHGVGRALIEAVHSAAKSAGIPDIYWQTQEFNYKGRMLYDKVGIRTPFIIYEKHG